ncbi:uncharacterized protein DEA37_0012773 [Paragonimus westermani]|uniref:Integrase catalytic domain-containing protein n=1 Tax=Paragonimus westermani TaxID=34504 RepID=A0A5J4NW82_9TREM|nr:uncharacterized protein DEA37_0012773 [Paragonimus westermani]
MNLLETVLVMQQLASGSQLLQNLRRYLRKDCHNGRMDYPSVVNPYILLGKDFVNKCRFAHEISSPYHTQSNGKAESAVKEAKKIMKKCLATNEDPYLVLLEHRNTPSADIELSPVQRLSWRRTKTRIPLVENALDPYQTPWTVTRQRLKKRMEGEALIYDRGSRELPQLAEEARPHFLGNAADVVRSSRQQTTTVLLTPVNDYMSRRSLQMQNTGGTEIVERYFDCGQVVDSFRLINLEFTSNLL